MANNQLIKKYIFIDESGDRAFYESEKIDTKQKNHQTITPKKTSLP